MLVTGQPTINPNYGRFHFFLETVFFVPPAFFIISIAPSLDVSDAISQLPQSQFSWLEQSQLPEQLVQHAPPSPQLQLSPQQSFISILIISFSSLAIFIARIKLPKIANKK